MSEVWTVVVTGDPLAPTFPAVTGSQADLDTGAQAKMKTLSEIEQVRQLEWARAQIDRALSGIEAPR